MMLFAPILLWLALGQTPVPPLNAAGVATNCDNQTIQCAYTDQNVPPGPHFYFAVAEDTTGKISAPSNVVNATVPAGTHNVVLSWTPSTSTNVTYFLYRGGVPTNLQITNIQ